MLLLTLVAKRHLLATSPATFTHDLVCHHHPYLYHMKGSDPGDAVLAKTDGALQDNLQRRPTQISVWRRAAATALRALKRFVRN